MRLKSIKLSGFKSFVDPTTVTFPSNMAAIVGPNGCGKSNIIDAVRWVMGESSAKNLRGESMTDVIFNGSNTRKPVSQASIELIFDNTDGSLGGEYAAYTEISIRRRVSREGQNHYFLNGSKCRRRDITDIFLGTGLGPRSYSIIEQGMISRLIEARPDDLRHYIEEAAGISKYKERRRETENRIRRTQENLARLTDLREELDRQLDRLQRQAHSAEKYQRYKEEERLFRAQLNALRWRELNDQALQMERAILDQEVALEALNAEHHNAGSQIETFRETHHEAVERFNQVQGRFYAVGGDITRVEQNIQYAQQRIAQLQDDLKEAQRAREEAETLLGSDRALMSSLQEELTQLQPEHDRAIAAAEESAIALETLENALQSWQQQWDRFASQSAEPRQQAEVEQSGIRHLEAVLERLQQRERRLLDEREQLQADPQELAISELSERLAVCETALETHEDEASILIERLGELREDWQVHDRQQRLIEDERQQLNGRIASLEALQEAALDPGTQERDWLRRQGLERSPRLAAWLQVEPGWEAAVETVLAADLQAVLVETIDIPALRAFDKGKLSLLQPGPAVAAWPGTLMEKVHSDVDLSPWLGQIIPVDTLEDAFERRPQLAADQSFVTRDGYWLGRHFIRMVKSAASENGMLARGQLLKQLIEQRQSCDERLAEHETQLNSLREALQAHERRREEMQQIHQRQTQVRTEIKTQLSAMQARHEQSTLRRQRVQEELTELAEQRDLEREQLAEARGRLQEALDRMGEDTVQCETLQQRRDQLRQQLEQARHQARQDKDQAHQYALRVGSLKAQTESTRQSLSRLEQQTERLQERFAQLDLMLDEGGEPIETLKEQREVLLEQRLQADEQMRQARLAMEEADEQLREVEKRRIQTEQQGQLLRDQLESQRLNWQQISTRRQTLQEHMIEDGYDLQTVLSCLPQTATQPEWESQLQTLADRIERLGPINLAAIEEFQQQSERSQYLQAQQQDLEDALQTLESVIRKIDRETRQRFKDTFDRIDTGLQGLFPKVFGGGNAYLELTGEDLLDTGVAIIARPPGKKNSTIHLLSGGEKALTALALVFAIFQLNPAPFCMLDEVDAPLDDTNVSRYARLVKEMSQTVQFIYITHNKIAMELADHLMGVTMHEPGCSRMVSVDMEEAIAMVET